jgi:SAM-dependent methyltransferase
MLRSCLATFGGKRHGTAMSRPVPQIFSAARRQARLARALARQARGDAAGWLRDAMAEDCLERLAFLRFRADRALILGLVAPSLEARLAPFAGAVRVEPAADLENPLPLADLGLILCLGELDTINDLPGALIHLRAALAPGGMLLASFLGAGSLPRLRQALLAADGARPAARLHPQIDNRGASALLQRAGFARQVVDSHTLTVRYAALGGLVADLRDQALTSVLADRAPPLTRAAFRTASAAFAAEADADGKTSETFEILTLTAWKD